MTEIAQNTERHYKKGDVIYKKGDYTQEMCAINYGRVAVYAHFGEAEQTQVEELGEGEFINVITFLEARMRLTTVVALEETVVTVITRENFEDYFRARPAKIMQLLQDLSARIRHLTADYLEVCRALEERADVEEIKGARPEWYEAHEKLYQLVKRMLPLHEGQ